MTRSFKIYSYSQHFSLSPCFYSTLESICTSGMSKKQPRTNASPSQPKADYPPLYVAHMPVIQNIDCCHLVYLIQTVLITIDLHCNNNNNKKAINSYLHFSVLVGIHTISFALFCAFCLQLGVGFRALYSISLNWEPAHSSTDPLGKVSMAVHSWVYLRWKQKEKRMVEEEIDRKRVCFFNKPTEF